MNILFSLCFLIRSTIDSNRSDDNEHQRKNAIHAIEAALERFMVPMETQQKEASKQLTAMRHELRKYTETINRNSEAWIQPRDVILVLMFVLLHSLLQMYWGKR